MIEKKQNLKFFRERDSIEVEKRDKSEEEGEEQRDEIEWKQIRAKSMPKLYFFLHMDTKLT